MILELCLQSTRFVKDNPLAGTYSKSGPGFKTGPGSGTTSPPLFLNSVSAYVCVSFMEPLVFNCLYFFFNLGYQLKLNSELVSNSELVLNSELVSKLRTRVTQNSVQSNSCYFFCVWIQLNVIYFCFMQRALANSERLVLHFKLKPELSVPGAMCSANSNSMLQKHLCLPLETQSNSVSSISS